MYQHQSADQTSPMAAPIIQDNSETNEIYTNEMWTEDGAMAMLEAELLRTDAAPVTTTGAAAIEDAGADLFDEDDSLMDLLTRAENQLKEQKLWQYSHPLHRADQRQQQVSSIAIDRPPPSSPQHQSSPSPSHCQQLVVYTPPPPATRAAAFNCFPPHNRIPPAATTRIPPAFTATTRIPPAFTATSSRQQGFPPAASTSASTTTNHPYRRPRAILGSNSMRHEQHFDFDGLIRFSDPSRRRTIALKHLSDAFQYPVLGARVVRSYNKDAVIIRVANVGRRGNEDAEIETFMPHRFTTKITRANVQSFNSGCHNLIMQVVHSEGRSSDIRLNRRPLR
ncbi:uncharacterized protein LOC120354488 [Nilaparvata lugens]|uniref:uncharacterized protein LOC120354488 n=1 Tax=Nilaparvata lugens TaxID=108931 RepID=UPI00193D08CF|nr:uncharacterized protein LOC120354488 [Nilaparvata lugens]